MTIGIRLDPNEERMGADFVEHNIRHSYDSNIIFSSRCPSVLSNRLEGVHELQEVTCDRLSTEEFIEPKQTGETFDIVQNIENNTNKQSPERPTVGRLTPNVTFSDQDNEEEDYL